MDTEVHIKVDSLERTVQQLMEKIIVLEERIKVIERNTYQRYSRGPSFFTGDPYIFPPEQG
jgi:hypothetical protein